jgi:Protein of unknown function (DUF2442)
VASNVAEARPVVPYRVYVRFDDGAEDIIDLQDFAPFQGVFAPLRDPNEFAKVTVNSDLGTVSWPSGADLDPLVIRQALLLKADGRWPISYRGPCARI